MAQSLPTFGIQERWEHYLRRTYSWQRMGLMGVDVAADMVVSKPAGGRSTECFNDRYAGAFFAAPGARRWNWWQGRRRN